MYVSGVCEDEGSELREEGKVDERIIEGGGQWEQWKWELARKFWRYIL